MKLFVNKAEDEYDEIIEIKMPYDFRGVPKHQYGICGLKIWFILRKNNKAVQFLVYFKTYPSSIEVDPNSLDIFTGA